MEYYLHTSSPMMRNNKILLMYIHFIESEKGNLLQNDSMINSRSNITYHFDDKYSSNEKNLVYIEKKKKTFALRRQRGVSWAFVFHSRYHYKVMSYYDDYYDDCLSDDDDYDVYYHNYSVDYANQLLNGHHAITSCLPRQRRKHHRHTPRLVRVATLDQMPITNRPQVVPSLHSQPKYGINQQIPVPPLNLTSRLPTLEATNEEMERRISRRPEPISEVNISVHMYSKHFHCFR